MRTCRCRPSWQSEDIVLGTFFNGGLRAYDISNPYQPKEVGAFVPPPPKRHAGRRGAAQRRVRRRARDRLHGRSPHRRAVHPRNGFLIERAASFRFATTPARSAAGRSASAARRSPSPSSPAFSAPGKPRCCKHFLATPEGAGTAIVVNEFGAAGIDDALLRSSADETVLLGNGCLCCVTRSDLQIALRRWWPSANAAQIPDFRRIVIETSGLADPGPILQTFCDRPRAGRQISCRGADRGRRCRGRATRRWNGRRKRASRRSSPTA